MDDNSRLRLQPADNIISRSGDDAITNFTKLLLSTFLVAGGTALAITTFDRNPSAREAQAHFLMMNKDMNSALKAGGKIDSKYSNSKNGGSMIIANIRAESWSSGLAEKYREILMSLGWTSKSNLEYFALCKDGALAEISLIKGFDASHGFRREIHGFTMTYNAITKDDCIAGK
jgi:hypothetical protein